MKNIPVEPTAIDADKNFNADNHEFRLKTAEPYFTKKAIEFMKANNIRKRTDLVYMSVKKYIGI